MSKKAIYIITPAVLILIALGIWLYRTYKNVMRIDYGIGAVKLKYISLLEGFEVSVNILLKNFSEMNVNINQLKVDLYTQNDIFLSGQPEPLTEPIKLNANQNTPVNFKYTLSPSAIILLAKNSGIDKNLLEIANNYLDTGTIGAKIKLKGFVTAEGLTVKINEIVEV